MIRTRSLVVTLVLFAFPVGSMAGDLRSAALAARPEPQTAPAAPPVKNGSGHKRLALGLLIGGGVLSFLGATKDTSSSCTSTGDFGVSCDTSDGGGLLIVGGLAGATGATLLIVDAMKTPSVRFVPKGVAVGYAVRF